MAWALLFRPSMQRRKFDLRSVTGPVLRHLLARELKFPQAFLLRCVATLGAFKRRIDPRFPDELVELAALPLWVYINLSKKIGAPKAFEIMRVAVLTGGVAQWNLAYATVDRPRTFENLYEQELEVHRTGPTRWNSLEVVERTDRRFELKVTRCMYHELAQSLGIPEITPIVCQLDNAAFNSYLPDEVIFHRGGPGHRISDGAPECRFVFQKIGGGA